MFTSVALRITKATIANTNSQSVLHQLQLRAGAGDVGSLAGHQPRPDHVGVRQYAGLFSSNLFFPPLAVNIAICGIFYFSAQGNRLLLPMQFRRSTAIAGGGDKPPNS